MTQTPKTIRVPEAEETQVSCPHCEKETTIYPPDNYAPFYQHCSNCSEKFIAERTRDGFDLYKIGEAPCLSDPECRIIEFGGGQEE